MQGGYLLVETHPAHPGLVRIRTAEQAPAERATDHAGAPRLRYAARFDDLSAAQMHAHELLRRRLVDVDSRLYRTDPITAVSAAESIGLHHRRVYLDPELAAEPALAEAIARRCARRQRLSRLWDAVGIGALLFLLARLLLGF